jgi:hypothetical protein
MSKGVTVLLLVAANIVASQDTFSIQKQANPNFVKNGSRALSNACQVRLRQCDISGIRLKILLRSGNRKTELEFGL